MFVVLLVVVSVVVVVIETAVVSVPVSVLFSSLSLSSTTSSSQPCRHHERHMHEVATRPERKVFPAVLSRTDAGTPGEQFSIHTRAGKP